jgi:hypothetical protein
MTTHVVASHPPTLFGHVVALMPAQRIGVVTLLESSAGGVRCRAGDYVSGPMSSTSS